MPVRFLSEHEEPQKPGSIPVKFTHGQKLYMVVAGTPVLLVQPKMNKEIKLHDVTSNASADRFLDWHACDKKLTVPFECRR